MAGKDGLFKVNCIKSAVIAALTILVMLFTNGPSMAEPLDNQTETIQNLSSESASPARFKLGVEIGASWHDTESRMVYGGNQYEFKIKYSGEAGLRLRYELSPAVALEGGLSYDWYRSDITPELTHGTHSSAWGCRLSFGPCFTFDVLAGNDIKAFVHPTVDWQYLDFDLDLPVRSYKSGPGASLAFGLTRGALKLETGFSLSGHDVDRCLPGTWVAKDMAMDRAFVRATVYYFDLPF
jgi:hypothetical protein